MEFPVTGSIILAIAAWFFFFRPQLLYPATIIAIPFSSTAVVNFPMAGSQYGLGINPEKSITAVHLFAVLWIVREALSRFPQWRRRGWFITRRARFWLLGFLAAIGLSLCVPIILNGTAWIKSWETTQEYIGTATVPLRLTRYNLTQLAYLAFGITFAAFIAAENWHPARLLRTLRLYVWSSVFVAGWGLFQFWCTVTGHRYPDYIFNTSKVAGYLQTISAGGFTWNRISSVVTYAGMMAQVVVVGLGLLLVCLAFRRPILPRGWNWVAIALTAAVLTVSSSSTAYFGMFTVLILTGFVLARAGKRQWKYYVAVAVAAVVAGAVVVERTPLLRSVVDFLVLYKYSGINSGAKRLDSVKIAAQAFLHYPILGVGWRNVQCDDLVFELLANTGVMGLLAFGAFLLPVFRNLWRMNSRGSFSATIVLLVLAWGLIFAEAGGVPYGVAIFWFILGLAAGAVGAASVELQPPFLTHRRAKMRPHPGSRSECRVANASAA